MGISVRARYVALPVSAALLALTGCASSGTGGGASATPASESATPLKLIQAAYATTTSAKTAHIAINFRFSGPGVSPGGSSIMGVEDFQHRSADTTASIAGQATIEERDIGSDLYLKISNSGASGLPYLNPKTVWTHYREDKGSFPASLGSLFGGAGADPTVFVRMLTDVSSSVTKVGSDDVHGQPSTHYRLTFDAAKIRKMDEKVGDCNPDDVQSDANTPVDVWLDGEGRLTRMLISIAGGATSTPPTGIPTVAPLQNVFAPASMTFEFYDYDAPVSIQPPPASQTAEAGNPFGSVSPATSSPTPCPTS